MAVDVVADVVDDVGIVCGVESIVRSMRGGAGVGVGAVMRGGACAGEDDGGHIVVVVRVGAVAATDVSELELLLTSFPPSAGNMRVELGGRADSLLRWFTE